MKKLFSLICVLAIMMSIIVVPAINVSADNIEPRGRATEAVNLRMGPSTDSSVIVVLTKGREFNILDTSNPDWTYIYLDSGALGYVSAQYVETISTGTSSVPVVDESNETRGVTKDYVNLHSSPDFNSSIVAILEPGRTFSVFTSNNLDFCFIYLDSGAVGYLNPNYVSITKWGNTDNFNELNISGGTTAKPTPTIPPVAENTETRGKTKDYVNLHSSADLNSSVVAVLEPGRTFSIFKSDNLNFCFIYLDTGAVGYLNPAYVEITKQGNTDNFSELTPPIYVAPTPTPTPEVVIETMGKAKSNVNLHFGPDANSNILAVLSPGRTFTVFESAYNGWALVYLDSGALGYVNTDYIAIVREGTTDNLDKISTNPPDYSQVNLIQSTVKSSALSMLNSPETGSGLICQIPYGAVVSVVEFGSSQWAKVIYGENTGYVLACYLDLGYESAGYTWAYVDGYKRCFDTNGNIIEDVSDLVDSSSYYVMAYKHLNTVVVYAKDGSNGYTIPVKSMIASFGNPTPTGDFYSPNKWRWLQMVGDSYAQWCTQISGNYLFHSVPSWPYQQSNTSLNVGNYNLLGTTQSLGCIRLNCDDAKWLYDNWSKCAGVTITNSGYPPVTKPEIVSLPSWHTWDPTDPTAHAFCVQYGCH